MVSTQDFLRINPVRHNYRTLNLFLYSLDKTKNILRVKEADMLLYGLV